MTAHKHSPNERLEVDQHVAVLSSKGQVVIPKAIRHAMGVDAGTRMVFLLQEDGTVSLQPCLNSIESVFGLGKAYASKNKRDDDFLSLIRQDDARTKSART